MRSAARIGGRGHSDELERPLSYSSVRCEMSIPPVLRSVLNLDEIGWPTHPPECRTHSASRLVGKTSVHASDSSMRPRQRPASRLTNAHGLTRTSASRTQGRLIGGDLSADM